MEIGKLYSYFLTCDSVSTDTRKIGKNSLFFALKGGNFNGNEFAQRALDSGAAFAVVDEVQYAKNDKCILVDDVLETLQKLATFHRSQLDIPIIAITGSNGKTTTKELLHAVLSKKYSVGYTKGNLNNHIGVPLTILDISSENTVALIEMGDNHPEEVEFLCDIAQPNYGFVTNVGKDHLEGFGSFERNVEAKKEIFDYLDDNGGTAFLDVTDDIVSKMVGSKTEVVTYGDSSCYSFIEFGGANPLVEFVDEEGTRVSTHLFGAFNFDNIKLAYCIGKYFNVPHRQISEALREYIPTNNRSQVVSTSRNTLIMDAYNANPSSVFEAVKSFSEMHTTKKKWLVLGDMFELGSYAEAEHLSLINYSMAQGFDEVIFIGETYSKVSPNKSINAFGVKSEAEEYIKKIAPEGAIILLKGSRGMQMETLKEVL